MRAWRLGGAASLVAALGLAAGPAFAGEAGAIRVEPDIQHLWSGETVEFTVRVGDRDDAGRAAAVLRWKFVLSGAALAEGEKDLGDTERVTVTFEAPRVRHVSEVAWRLALLRGDDVRARDEKVLRVYPAWDPQPILRLLEHKRVGLADPSGRLQKLLADSGLAGPALTSAPEALPTAAAVRAFSGDALIMGPGAGEAPNLAAAALEAAAAGQTVIWLEPGDTSSWRETFGLPQARRGEPMPPLVLAPEHPALSGVNAADLTPWRGEGGPGFIMDAPEGGNFRGLVAVAGEKPGYSLLELFPGSGRIILCQLPVASRFDGEPVARMLFELLLKYGLSDTPRFAPATLWAAPDSTLPLLAEKAGLVLAEEGAPGEGLFVIAAGAQGREPVGAGKDAAPVLAGKIRAHLEAGGKCLFIGAEAASSGFLQRCGMRDVGFEPAPEKPGWTVEPVPLAWGISTEDIAAAARAGGQAPLFQYQAIASGAKVAVAPGAIVKVPVGPGEAILCQLALDRAPEDPAVIALFRQLLTSLGARLERKDPGTVPAFRRKTGTVPWRRGQSTGGQSLGAHVAADEPSPAAKVVAVLDFRDLGPSVELEPLRKALAKMLTTDLSSYGQIEVVARERVDRIIQETHLGESGLVGAETAQKAGRALAADYLVQGTFSGRSDRIAVTLEVFDVAAGRVITSTQEAGSPDDVLAIEGKLLSAVTKAVGARHALPLRVRAAQPGGKPVSLAVLYFQNLSPDAKLDPMEVGFADLLISYLQDRKGIAVVEREQLNKVLEELGLQKSALADSAPQPKIGQMLGAQVMVLGSFLVVKDTIRFDAHLVAADTGALMHAVSVQAPTADLDAPLRALADRVATALAAPRATAGPEREAKTSVEAALHYSHGLKLQDERHYVEAASELQQCLYLAPDNTEAMRRLANLYHWPLLDHEKAARLLERLVARPRENAQDCADSVLLGWCYYSLGQPERQVAVLLDMFNDPRVSEGYRPSVAFDVAMAYERMGQFDEAIRWCETALAGTTTPGIRANERLHLAYYFRDRKNDSAAAMRHFEAIIEEAPPEDAWIRGYFVYWAVVSLGDIYEAGRAYERAKHLCAEVSRKFPGTVEEALAQYGLGRAASAAGHEREAAETFVQTAEAAPALDVAPEALMRAASIYSNSLRDAKRATELVRLAILRYGRDDRVLRYDRQIRDLPTELVAPLEPDGPRPVLIDEGHGESWAYDVGQWGQSDLRAALLAGRQWTHVNRRPLTHDLLAGYSVLILNSSGGNAALADEEEIEALRSFVATGGGVLVNLAGRSATDYLQYGRLLSLFGASVTRGSYLGSGKSVTMLQDRQRFREAREALASHGVPPRVPEEAMVALLRVPEETVVATYEGHPVLAALDYGLGRVILSGLGAGLQNQILRDGGDGSDRAAVANRLLARAAVEWLRGSDRKEGSKDAFEAVMRKWAMGDLSGALAGLRKIIADNPGTRAGEEAALLAADLLRSKGDTQAATAEYERLAKSAKEPQVKALALLNLARCHAAGGAPGVERALEECWAIWREDQTNPWAAPALIEGGKWAYEDGRFDDAQAAFDTVMNSREHGMDKLQAMLWAALCREKRDDPATAARIYRAVEAEYPNMYGVPLCGRQGVKEYAHARAQQLSP